MHANLRGDSLQPRQVMYDTATQAHYINHRRLQHDWVGVNAVRHIQEIQVLNGSGRIEQIECVIYAQTTNSCFIEVDILYALDEPTGISNRTTTTA